MDERMDSILDRCSIVYIFDWIPDAFFIYSILTRKSPGRKRKKENLNGGALIFGGKITHKWLKH